MRTIRVQARAATTCDGAFDAIAALDGHWRVPFRRHAIRWRQRCAPAPDRRAITFTLVAGDFRHLTGEWRMLPAAGGCDVLFEATYDVGVPIYDRILDPLVEHVLDGHVRAIIAGLHSRMNGRGDQSG